MAGDRALSMLIDIRARDSASSIVRSLGSILTGLANPFKLIAQGAKTAINSMDYFIATCSCRAQSHRYFWPDSGRCGHRYRCGCGQGY